MSRFNTDAFRSLNKNIAAVQNSQAAIAEAMEYTSALESVLLALCEELEIDLNSLLEDLQTTEREEEMTKIGNKLRVNIGRAKTRKQLDKADKAHIEHEKLDSKERSAKTLYGKGGKRIRNKEEIKKVVNRDKARKKQFDRSYAKSAAWHRSMRGNRDHDAQMDGYDDHAHRERIEAGFRRM